ATFAIYHDVVKEPKDLEVNIFERSARLISIVLQNFAYIKSIQESSERFEYINKATNNAIYDWDLSTDNFYWGNSLTRVFGHNISEDKFRLRDWAQWVHPDDLDEVLQNLDMFMAQSEESKWLYEYRFKDANGQYAYVEEVGYLIRNENGQPLRMIGALRDQTQFKRESIKQELQHELSQLFKQEEGLNAILKKSIKYLSQFGGYPVGEIWLMSQNHKDLHLSAWYAKSGDKEVFYDENSKKTFQYGEGLPGTVWKTLKNEVWNEIDKNSNFYRYKLAEKANFKSATAYPLFYQDNIIGVLVLFSDEELKAHDHNVMFYNNLKHYLGAEIIRKQQEKELSLFFESAPEILAIASPDGNFVKVNTAFSKLLGYSQEELTSKPFSEFIHPEDLKETITEYDDSLEKNRVTNNFTNRYITKSGEYKWISWSSSKVFGEEGYFFAYGRDVTETVELQKTIENASKLAKVGGWEINQLTGENYWSPMTKQIHEVPDDFTPNLDEAINFYHPNFQRKITKAVENAIQEGESFDFEAIIITYKGNEKWVRAIGNAEMRDGECVRLYGSFQDINDRKMIELRLENISNNIPGVIFQYHLKPNGDDLMDFVSRRSEEIFGYTPEECVQNNELIWKNIEAGGDLNQMKEAIMESANSLSNWQVSWRYQHPDGNIYWHEGYGHPMKKPDGTILWDSVIVDITDKRKAEEEIELANMALKKYARDLEISNAELEQFAYVASHDLQEPLRMVSGFLTQLEKKYGNQLDDKANQYIDFAVDGAKRMRQIILDLLDYSKIGKKEEEITEIDLNEVIYEVCLLQRKQIEELSVNVEFKDLPKIKGHPSPMIQIFSNLISNGIKYSYPNLPPKIIIKANELKNEWRFSVKDNGIGIEEEYFDRIFNIFQRLHNKNEYSGTGMGLAIVKKIIENLNGRIWVKSNIGKGSTFYFTIPKS
uniref:PAS domain-containing protein n=1 Tax=Marivirga sp. TaxID=2018662 RepID=UPI0025F93647